MSRLSRVVLLGAAIIIAFNFAGVFDAVLTRLTPLGPFIAPYLGVTGALAALLIAFGVLRLGVSYHKQKTDLRETVQTQAALIQEKNQELQQREKLLLTVNSLADLLLTVKGQGNVQTVLQPGLELIGRCLAADRVQIWRRMLTKGEMGYVHTYQWLSEQGARQALVPIGMSLLHREHPAWEERLMSGAWINTPVAFLPQHEQEIFRPFATASVLIVPLIIEAQLWGFLKVEDCGKGRYYSGEETDTLNAAGKMIATVIDNDAQGRGAGQTRETTEEVFIPGGFRRGVSEVA